MGLGTNSVKPSLRNISRAPLTVFAVINVDLGLNYCGGDESFFREMLRMFHAKGGDKKAEIISLYEAENWTDYAIKVHAHSGTPL